MSWRRQGRRASSFIQGAKRTVGSFPQSRRLGAIGSWTGEASSASRPRTRSRRLAEAVAVPLSTLRDWLRGPRSAPRMTGSSLPPVRTRHASKPSSTSGSSGLAPSSTCATTCASTSTSTGAAPRSPASSRRPASPSLAAELIRDRRPEEHADLLRTSSRRIHATFAVPYWDRLDAVRFLAEQVAPSCDASAHGPDRSRGADTPGGRSEAQCPSPSRARALPRRYRQGPRRPSEHGRHPARPPSPVSPIHRRRSHHVGCQATLRSPPAPRRRFHHVCRFRLVGDRQAHSIWSKCDQIDAVVAVASRGGAGERSDDSHFLGGPERRRAVARTMLHSETLW